MDIGELTLNQIKEIIYDTGPHNKVDWDKAEDMANGWCVCIQAIESHGFFK